jgi:medium-chain acyl-[acyl-carrier-protein] hydrolase
LTQRLDSPCLIRPRSSRSPATALEGTAKIRLLCFPYAGGAPSVFFGWPELLGPEVDVIWVQLRGRGSRFLEKPLHDVKEIAEEVAAAVVKLDETPFCFYGHSLGALVAYEVARILRRDGHRQPGLLLMGAARAPHLERILPPLAHLPDREFVDAIQTRYSGIPEAVLQDEELMQLFLPVLRADFNAYEGYRHTSEPALDQPIAAFAGSEDPVVTVDAVNEWHRHTSAAFATYTLPGDHFFLTSNRDRLVQIVKQTLLNVTSISKDRSGEHDAMQEARM